MKIVTNNEDSTMDQESCTSASTFRLLADVGVHEAEHNRGESLVGAGQAEDEVDDDNVQWEIESLVDQKFDLADSNETTARTNEMKRSQGMHCFSPIQYVA